MAKLQVPFEDHFWSKVNRNGPVVKESLGPCWLWTMAIQKKHGYAVVTRDYTQYYAHRIAYELKHGSIPDGLELDHLCRTRHCVNPKHLEPVTGKTNVLRGTSFSAINARKTHCKRGHPLSGDNIFSSGNAKRRCLTCHRKASRESMRRHWEKKRSAA